VRPDLKSLKVQQACHLRQYSERSQTCAKVDEIPERLFRCFFSQRTDMQAALF